MPLALRWVGYESVDPLAETRLRCYGTGDGQRARFIERTRDDPRAVDGDFLLAEQLGEPVGTATSLSLTMWVRGAPLPCQGVAWVGAVKTARRRGTGAGAGVASTVMAEVLRRAREREQVVSALMPFRGSFYEHFGYGFVERRCDWTVPMGVLPTGSFEGIRFCRPDDFAARAACLAAVTRAGQCAVERSEAFWRVRDTEAAEGFQVVDRPAADGPVLGSMTLLHTNGGGRDVLKVSEIVSADSAALRRQLHFLASQRDQYAAVHLQLPADLPLQWLLKEAQIPHRPVHHAVAEPRPFTRMQVRILDHIRFLRALHLPAAAPAGRLTLCVREPEGDERRIRIEVADGRISAEPTQAEPQFMVPAPIWAAVATGELPASRALQLGLAEGSAAAAGLLDALAIGPTPFSHEYF